MKKTIYTIVILVVVLPTTLAQSLKRANNLFDKKAYVEAAEMYLELEERTPEIIANLGDCFYYNNNMAKAAKWYSLLFKEQPTENLNDFSIIYRYALSLKGLKEYDDADEQLKTYYELTGLDTSTLISTKEFINELELENRRPYIIHPLTVNSEYSDFGVTQKGDQAVFASSRGDGASYDWNGQAYLNLYGGVIDDNGDINYAEPFSDDINTKMHESNAVFTKDGNTMYFTRNSYSDGKKQKDDNKITNLKIYKAELVDNNWMNIVALPFCSDNFSVVHPSLSADEKQLYFASDMPGSLGSYDIFVVNITDGGYGTPKNLGETVNTIHREQFPFISAKNNLYFASDGHFGLGGLDIFVSKSNDGKFTEPKNLGTIINSNADDFAFVIDEEKEAGFLSSNRTGGKGDDDIYRFSRVRKYFVKGKVQDINSKMLLPGTLITLFDSNNNSIADTIVGSDATYKFEIFPNSEYTVRGTRKLYIPQNIDFSTNYVGDMDKDIMLSLESYEDAEKRISIENGKTQININPIFFDYDKWNIRPDAAKELDNVVEIMTKYPEMQIEIGAHTDARGGDNYNLKLSHKRAASVREYLVENGVSDENVKSVGYGETQPLNECTEPNMCKESEYDINRRCEFVILN